jgi:hypothetical protein
MTLGRHELLLSKHARKRTQSDNCGGVATVRIVFIYGIKPNHIKH